MPDRYEQRQARMEVLRQAKLERRVRVNPRDEIIRRDIKHGNISFPAEGSVEWPLDQFTKRRLRDGSVTLEGEQEQKAPAEQRGKERERPTS